jgi:hypothetical protein
MTIRGVIVTVIETLLVVSMGLFAYDYQAVRVAAAKGAASYEFLEKAIAAQQAQKPPVPSPPQEEKK